MTIQMHSTEALEGYAESFEVTVAGATYRLMRAGSRWTALCVGARRAFLSNTSKDNALRMLELQIALASGRKVHLTTTPAVWTPATPETSLWARIA